MQTIKENASALAATRLPEEKGTQERGYRRYWSLSPGGWEQAARVRHIFQKYPPKIGMR